MTSVTPVPTEPLIAAAGRAELVRPRPRWVHVFSGGQIVVVDDVHPVAWLLADDGSCRRQLSWADQPQPPREPAVGPFRRSFTVADDLVSVYDQGVPHAIELNADGPGEVRWGLGPASSTGEGRARRSITHRELTTAAGSWRVRSRVDDSRRSVEVTLGSAPATQAWTFDRASPLSATAYGDGLLVVLREADKRPWVFDPPRRLVRLTATAGPQTWVLPPVEEPWTPHPVALDDEGLLHGLRHSLADVAAAVTHLGAIQPEVAVRQPAGRPPSITAAFTLPDGRRLSRTNEPYDILGNRTDGLAGLSIWLEEEILGGIDPSVVDGAAI